MGGIEMRVYPIGIRELSLTSLSPAVTDPNMARIGVPKDVAAVAAPEAGSVKLFGKWDAQEVEVKDISLQDYISLRNAVYTPHTAGRYANKQFRKAQMPIVERLVNSLMMHGRNNGKKLMAVRIVSHAFEIIHLLTDANPIQILVDAVINTGPREDSTRIGSQGTVRRQAVDVSPLRRVNQSISLLTTGTRESAFRNVKSVAECLADELINAAKGSSNSAAIKRYVSLAPRCVRSFRPQTDLSLDIYFISTSTARTSWSESPSPTVKRCFVEFRGIWEELRSPLHTVAHRHHTRPLERTPFLSCPFAHVRSLPVLSASTPETQNICTRINGGVSGSASDVRSLAQVGGQLVLTTGRRFPTW